MCAAVVPLLRSSCVRVWVTTRQALLLFKAALPWFRRALSHYQLDGWVTEHVNTLFEMSNLYRCDGCDGDMGG